MINYFKEDLTPILENRQFQVFAHGCNCFSTMGAGIARTVANIFPKVYEADQKSSKGDIAKLGTIDAIKVPPYSSPHIIVNAYTQYKYWGKEANVDYKAIASCFTLIHEYMEKKQLTELTIPKIGAGLARGDWNLIEDIILDIFPNNFSIKVYYF